jgi:hypothetical protein
MGKRAALRQLFFIWQAALLNVACHLEQAKCNLSFRTSRSEVRNLNLTKPNQKSKEISRLRSK